MRTFLVVSPRLGHAVARAEFDDFLNTAGLDATEMEHYMLDSPTAQLPDLSRYAGVFIGGSPFNVTNEHYSEHQLAVHEQLDAILHSPVPSLFVCFGTGFSQAVRGGEVGHTHPEVAGLTTVTLSDAAASDPLTAGVPATFRAMTGHKENVVTPAPGSTVLATGPGGFVHMLRTHEHSWATQFHPEMNAAGMKRRMSFYMNDGYFAKDDYERICAELDAADVSPAHTIVHNFIAFSRNYVPQSSALREPAL
ncbi:glutamine amidotransferase [Corynebacterium sp. 11A]|uniref:glutamine amidotransferase-related protein n=1 Tax=Corynebacterium sp. 11A TaxID=2080510 RepID=UPI00178C1F9B|nr:glutamine amidotransferase [Corynebacterium sp. 11A]